MADPIIHETPTNPCRQCAGVRQVAQMSWRDPQFFVTCEGCGNSEGGESLEHAVETWNTNNPERDVDPADTAALAMQQVKRVVTPQLVRVIEQAAALFATQAQDQSLEAFVTWLQSLVSVAPAT